MILSESISDKSLLNQLIRLYRGNLPLRKRTNVVIDKGANSHLVRAKRFRAVFPQSKFILIFRDPLYNIEGLRRKWRLFQEADIEELCDFYESIHKAFIEDIKSFSHDVKIISLEQLIQDTDHILQEVASFCNLQVRKQPKTYDDKPDNPGKGYRNVINGKLSVSKDHLQTDNFFLTEEESNYVRNRLNPIYKKLLELSNDSEEKI